MPRDFRTYYEALGVTPNARDFEIERAHRALRKEMQDEKAVPDPRRALFIQTAYEVLSDPARRAEYDRSLGDPRPRATDLRRRLPWIGAGCLAVVGVALAGWLVLRPPAGPPPRDPRDILSDASLAVGRLVQVDMSGATKELGLAVALDQSTLVAACGGIPPTAQLLVIVAQRQVPARVAAEAAPLCRLEARGLGSWPLRGRAPPPARGEKVYGVRIDGSGQAALAEGRIGALGASGIEAAGEAASAAAGSPLLDTQGHVLGIAVGAGRFLPVPPGWNAAG